MDCTIRSVPTLDWEEARRVVIDVVKGLERTSEVEFLALEQAHGRVLAEDVHADRDYPTLRRSLRDGFAVQTRSVPGVLRVRGEVRAGEIQQSPLAEGEALEIMTGAPVPNEADAVVMVEHVTRIDGAEGTAQVKIDQAVNPGEWINERGSEAARGNLLVARGTRLDAGHISALAMVGKSSVPLHVRPLVAILATGDEIVSVDAAPAAHQIRNSNSFMLAALASAAGGRPDILPVAPDTRDELRRMLQKGLTYDMLLVSGGVSAGRYDLVKPVLRDLGTNFHFEKVRIQPGGPCAFGSRGSTPVFGLPGNPGSSYVTFQLFAQPALELLGGQSDPVLPLLTARFAAPFKHRQGLTRFLPAKLSADGQYLTHISWQGSSDVPALAKANVFLVADDYRDSWAIGDTIRLMRKL
jgi:molybdopterin molybdotransferase